VIVPYFEWFGYGLTGGLMFFAAGFVAAGPAYFVFRVAR
jgi:hypothetical protein